MLEWAAAQATGCDFCVDASTINTPHAGYWVGHLIIGVGNFRMLILAQDTSNEIWYTVQVQAGLDWKWLAWNQISTATPPQKFSLPLADDWVRVNAAEYWKTQEGIVVVTFRVAKTNGAAISAGTNHVATLPEGFRPVGYFTHAAVAIMKDNLVCAAWIDTNGWVMCNTSMDIPQSSGSEPALWAGFAGTFVFVAAS